MTAHENLPKEHFRFLDLPTELRLDIIDLVIIEADPITPSCCTILSSRNGLGKDFFALANSTPGPSDNKVPQPALSKTCNNLREETLKEYYSKNTFEVCYCPDFDVDAWLEEMGARRRAWLKKLYVHLPWAAGLGIGLRPRSVVAEDLFEKFGAQVVEDVTVDYVSGRYLVSFLEEEVYAKRGQLWESPTSVNGQHEESRLARRGWQSTECAEGGQITCPVC